MSDATSTTAPKIDLPWLVWWLEGCCPGCRHNSPWCGCGNPASGYMLLRDALKALPWYESRFWDAYPEGAATIIVGFIDGLGLLEHGSSWRGSWLTPFGEAVLAALGDKTDAEIEAARREDGLLGCGMDECENCARFDSVKIPS